MKSEVRKSDIRYQRSEVYPAKCDEGVNFIGGGESEVRRQKSEDRSQKIRNRSRKSEVYPMKYDVRIKFHRGRKTGDGRRETEDRRPKTEERSRETGQIIR